MGIDYYGLLNLPRDATADEIRAAYFDAAKRLHPDANPDKEAKEQFLAIQQAYEVLADEQKRAEYNRTLPESSVTGEVTVKIKYSRSVIPMLDEPQLMYVLVELVCSAHFDPTRLPPIEVCLVLDRSTSMNGPRLDFIKANAINLLKQLRPEDIVSIVTFSDRAEVMIPPTKVANLARSEGRINALQAFGATEIFQGLETGLSLLRTGSSATSIRQCILLTDGHTYGDEQACFELARKASEDGITLNALGIGHEWNDSFLDQLTSLSGGNAMYVSSPKDLAHYLEEKLGSLNRIYGRNAMLEFESDPGVELKYAFRIAPELAPLQLSSPINLGNILYGRSLSVLFEFMVNPNSPQKDEIRIAKGRVKVEIPSQSMALNRLFVDIKRAISSSLERETPPAAIVEAMAKLSLYRLQEKARKEVEDGDIDHAAQHLQYLATHLLAVGDRELAHTVLVETEHIQQSHRFSQEGDKRIKYGTRALLLLPGPEQNQP
jgi:Ca-activated chloride channel family protein